MKELLVRLRQDPILMARIRSLQNVVQDLEAWTAEAEALQK